MHYVYILKSLKDDDLYVGQTEDLKKRFKEHNDGKSISTKARRPFKLIYYEAYETSQLAIVRERSIKKFGQSYYQIKKRIGLI
ncbi:MAG: hypothetical protein A2V96_01105 [Candidatus Yonathbacteria bacterium RBG_16_43_6]|uniref:GIY-YIG domain-containing protein n=1 Tax=Candidatus Yonathbacteria bacterium RIFCSPLOWO2_01_FULL_43_27 TaxID=1802726 RepID=A0A1G2SBY8_9BACT|nr:MAG: hypothetical protein A2V96_01105 [Candidatus Yonathbacteria bacterium RBG_16_43_6]OHA82545.1 MAG: hypothetical protein A3B07_02925 [Candidatus Yonathbacteria bacterium RIFCSPLOWO2_01_FULL_43_27]